MCDDHEAPRLCIQTPPASSEAEDPGDEVDSDFDDDEEVPPSPSSSTRKRRTRRRRRHGKNQASTSNASTASGGYSPSEDDDGRTLAARGVVTWHDLGLGLGSTLGSRGGGGGGGGQRLPPQSPVVACSPQGRLAMARCEMAGQPLPTPPPPPLSPPELVAAGDASERMPFGRQLPAAAGRHWYAPALEHPGLGPPAAHAGWAPCSWEAPAVSVAGSPWQGGGAALSPLATTSMGMAPDHFGLVGFSSSCPCSPTGASALVPPPPLPTPAAAGAAPTAAGVPFWLHGSDLPLDGEDLAHKLRAMAPDTYED